VGGPIAGGGSMEYYREYLVHYYEIDRKRKLTLPALIRYFEDIAVNRLAILTRIGVQDGPM
jgi:hypothetical protein